MAVRPAALPGTPAGQVVPMGQPGVYRGYNLRETAAAAATVRIHAGIGVGDPVIGTVALAASSSADVWFDADTGIGFPSGLYVETVTGTTPEGFIRWSGPDV